MWRRVAAATGVAVLAVMAGCGGATNAASPPSSPSTSTPTSTSTGPVKDATYETTSDLVAALGKAGLPCADAFQQDAGASNPGVTSQGRCTLTGTPDQEVFATYDSQADAEAGAQVLHQFDSGLGTSYVVVGPNWLVNCGQHSDVATQVVAAIGGMLE